MDLDAGKFYQVTLGQVVAYGEHWFKQAKQIGGGSVGDHLAAMKRKGRGPKTIAAPDLPPGTVHIWNAFAQIHAARGGSEIGPNPISYLELDAYCRVTKTALGPWEIDVIRALDDAYLASAKE